MLIYITATADKRAQENGLKFNNLFNIHLTSIVVVVVVLVNDGNSLSLTV